METIVNQIERKKQLIAQGALYRAEIVMAKHAVHSGLRPHTLARSAMQQLVMRFCSTRRQQGSTGLSMDKLQTALPLLLTAVSGLVKLTSKKTALKALLGSVLATGITVAVTAALSRKKSREAVEVREKSAQAQGE